MRTAFELADIVRQFRQPYESRYPAGKIPANARVLDAIAQCRTSNLGGHLAQCCSCGAERNSYNSCKNRHCPKCQASARDRWLRAKTSDLLPVPYYHVVFTIPPCIASIALQNRRVVYSILFKASSSALLKLGQEKRHLGAQMGALAVLHTWGQNLSHHPHVHFIVPAGGLDENGCWKSCRSSKILLPVRVLSRLFRGIFLSLIRRAHREQKLQFHGAIKKLACFEDFCSVLKEAKRTEWVVYAKRPFGGPEQVLTYLGRYTHRVAISNQRIVGVGSDGVQFRWKDYRTGKTNLVQTVDGVEFLRRFLQHVLPAGFVRIRSFGFLANRRRKKNLQLCRDSLVPIRQAKHSLKEPLSSKTVITRPVVVCQNCKSEQWLVLATISRPKLWNTS